MAVDALIGNTGFVGGHLLKQHAFTNSYNSRTIRDAKNKQFELVVCAAAPGSMFEANKFPERDEIQIKSLISSLSGITAKQFVLISTIAVLNDFQAGDDESTVSFQTVLSYGRNRRVLEEYCTTRFENCMIVRLPALFGAGLKKNFLFDILNPMPTMLPQARFKELQERLSPPLGDYLPKIYRLNIELGLMIIDRNALENSGLRAFYDKEVAALRLSAVQFTNPDTRFQYYGMERLWMDIQVAMQAHLSVVHLAPEPLVAKDVYKALIGEEMPPTEARLHGEDMRTRHAALWGHGGPYISTASEVLSRLQDFFANEKAQ
ncbi:NAD(P)-dependent oxidoreductase [Rhizobium sp. LCM 4573]|uniref:NAD(P)-dependent oxidoreductase n=1 Tax=Rhizobium sp. LCM 4573 TaxID=1848291 RepID=UPI0008D9EA14|nr:NAD(P)-dependent oxidoreductase [Rhizobium sp. LCM 4573]OHV77115.1 hypothetical protein LCM4573_10115 [Rhizobium sp. LCM 4573]